MQIDEWLPLYKGNIYVVDEITGRMYLKKGEHLMRIAETASHRPFQDHELSISRHVPKREHTELTSRPAEESPAVGLGEGDLQPITPIVGVIGDMGRTPIPVAESTRQPSEREVYTSGRIPGREEFERGTEPLASGQTKRESAERDIDPQRAKGVEWALPTPMESRRPPREDIPAREELFQGSGRLGGAPQDGGTLPQNSNW